MQLVIASLLMKLHHKSITMQDFATYSCTQSTWMNFNECTVDANKCCTPFHSLEYGDND